MRRVMIGVGFVFGLVGWAATAVKTRPTTMVLVAGGAAFVNELLGLIHERGWYRWWLVYALSLFDVILVAVLIVWFGSGAISPCARRQVSPTSSASSNGASIA